MNKIAVALVHGIGKLSPDFASGMIGNIRAELGDLAENCVFEPIHWAPLLQDMEDELWQKMKECGRSSFLSRRHFRVSRKFGVDFMGNGIAYQPLPKEKGTYDKIHLFYANKLRVLAEKAGPNAPLCVIAHSLGTIISSNYFYDQQNREKKPELVSQSVGKETRYSALARGETLTNFYTMGSPIALWSMRYPDFGQPINFPALSEDFSGVYPGLMEASEWINFYNENDVIGFPLKFLNEKYNFAVKEDCHIKVGRIFSYWNPMAHVYFWDNTKVAKRIAEGLRRVLKNV